MTYTEKINDSLREQIIDQTCDFLGCTLPGMSTFAINVKTTQGDGPWVLCVVHTQAVRFMEVMAQGLADADAIDDNPSTMAVALVFLGTDVDRGIDFFTDEYQIDDAEALRALTPLRADDAG